MATRRQFLSDTSRVITSAGLMGLSFPAHAGAEQPSSLRKPAPEKLRIALIGCRSMGFGNLENALKQPGVECTALCDVDTTVLDKRTADVVKIQGKAPARYADYRRLLESKDVDAVIIGTPDHWHCLQFVAACEAGKDVYVEKPLANSIAECDIMVRACRKHNRVVQVGQQQRSGDHWKSAVEFIRAGKIGQVRKVNIWANFGRGVGMEKVPDSPVPAGVDYNMWLGPAPARPFNTSRFHGSWRRFWDYGGGVATDWGAHLIDVALWAKQVDYLPESVVAAGGNYSHDKFDHETFDTMSVAFQMKDHVISWENVSGIESGPYRRPYGLAFIGNDATLVIDREGWELLPETMDGGYRVPALPLQRGKESNHEAHMKNFIDCVRSRNDPACSIEKGRRVAVYAHMANIALRTRSLLVWDEKQQRFSGSEAANRLITPAYRAPWKLPAA